MKVCAVSLSAIFTIWTLIKFDISQALTKHLTSLTIYKWCPWQESNLHTASYLGAALARYKLASLPLSYRGKNCLVLKSGIEPEILSYQDSGIPFTYKSKKETLHNVRVQKLVLLFFVSGKVTNPGYTAHPTFRVPRMLGSQPRLRWASSVYRA